MLINLRGGSYPKCLQKHFRRILKINSLINNIFTRHHNNYRFWRGNAILQHKFIFHCDTIVMNCNIRNTYIEVERYDGL